jgi:hypothetical protein
LLILTETTSEKNEEASKAEEEQLEENTEINKEDELNGKYI